MSGGQETSARGQVRRRKEKRRRECNRNYGIGGRTKEIGKVGRGGAHKGRFQTIFPSPPGFLYDHCGSRLFDYSCRPVFHALCQFVLSLCWISVVTITEGPRTGPSLQLWASFSYLCRLHDLRIYTQTKLDCSTHAITPFLSLKKCSTGL